MLQDFEDLLLAVHIDDIHDDLFRLQEPMTAVDRLNEVVELIVDAQKDHAVTISLKVASAPRELLFRCEDAELPIGKVDRVPLAHIHILRAVDFPRRGDCLLDCVAFILKVVPEDKVIGRVFVDDAFCFCDPRVDAFAFFPRRLFKSLRCIVEYLDLPVLFLCEFGRPSQFVIADFHVGQVVSRIVIAEVRRLLDEERPCRQP